MKKIIYLGKIDFNGTGRKANACELEVELREKSGISAVDLQPGSYVEFSMCASVWNHIHSDIYWGGQCCEEVCAFFPHNKKVQRLLEIWREWHMNGMSAGCIHQYEMGWHELRIDPTMEAGWHINMRNANLQCWESPPVGIMGKACPVCEYAYGTKWLYRPIPESILQELAEMGFTV